jgi:hypothetical protein
MSLSWSDVLLIPVSVVAMIFVAFMVMSIRPSEAIMKLMFNKGTEHKSAKSDSSKIPLAEAVRKLGPRSRSSYFSQSE